MPITLEQVLQARDHRADRQRFMLQAYGLPLVSLTVVMPGSEKRTPTSLYIAQKAIEAIENRFSIAEMEKEDLPTGYEARYAIDMEALSLKRATVAIEESHPLGRLFDIDVIDSNGSPISREQIGEEPRECLVCGELSAACVRSRRHSVPEVLDVIETMVMEYKQEHD